jgi:hypothetical protein
MVRVDTLSESAAERIRGFAGPGPTMTIQSLIEILERQRGQAPDFCDMDLSHFL